MPASCGWIRSASRPALVALLSWTASADADRLHGRDSKHKLRPLGQHSGRASSHAKQRNNAYIGRKQSYTRELFNDVRAMLGQQAEIVVTRQTVYGIERGPAAEAALVAWGCEVAKGREAT